MNRRAKSTAPLALLVVVVAAGGGCLIQPIEFDLFPDTPREPGEDEVVTSDWDDDEDAVTDVNGDGESAPFIENIVHASWPPLGPDSTLTVTVSDDDGDLDELIAEFRNEVDFFAYGYDDEIVISAEELGDGFGPLVLKVRDERGGHDKVTIDDTLVDLGAPSADVEHTLVNASGLGEYGSLSVWIGDAWVLGGADIWVGDDLIMSESFPEGYPAGFADAWDWSVIDVAAELLPVGQNAVDVVVYDAAGNTESFTFDIRVDAEPPEALLYAPVGGEHFDAPFEILAGASDPEDDGASVWIEVLIGGALVAEGPGPLLSATVDPTDFVPGETTLEIWAYDVVGNRAPFTPVPVTLGTLSP